MSYTTHSKAELWKFKKKWSQGSLPQGLLLSMNLDSGVAKETLVCDAVLVTESKLGDEKEDSKTSLQNKLETDDDYVETVEGDLCIVA